MNMGVAEIIGIVLSLITTFGPRALDIYAEWQKEVGTNPTFEDWAALKAKIAAHNPDTY